MSYSLFDTITDVGLDSRYKEFDDHTEIITEISSDDFDDNILITLNFVLNNTSTKIKINKYSNIKNIITFIQNKYELYNIHMIYNDTLITNGSFYSLNIKNNSVIKIVNNMKTGINNNDTSDILKIFYLTKTEPQKNRTKLSEETINDNIDKYGYWGAFTEMESPQKKVKKNSYRSPEYNQKREEIDPSELRELGMKYHTAMQELFEREQKQKKEQDKLREKISLLKEKMKKSKDKKNKVVVEEKKETFCGFKKGFLL